MLPPSPAAAGAPPDRTAPTARIRAFVVDDSSVVRAFVTKALEAAPDVTVVGTAEDGARAIRKLDGLDVDVVVLDVEMPILDGLSALPDILKAPAQPPKVVMASTLTRRGASISIQALVKGAADYVPKPTSLGADGAEEFSRVLLASVRAWGAKVRQERERASARRPAPAAATATAAAPPRKPSLLAHVRRPEALAVGCSTGGPQALLRLFANLRGQRLGPVFVTQHMPPTFTTLFADQLGRISGRPCHEAVDGETVLDGNIYLAPGDWHMVAEGQPGAVRLRRLQTPPENWCRPSVDPMFRALAKIYGDRLLALVLTGMGHDGCAGARLVAEKGGTVLAQDEASSVVWGMPGAVTQAGIAREALDLDALAGRVGQLFGSPA
jgi:two-component system chemotaxis response regulator CheB